MSRERVLLTLVAVGLVLATLAAASVSVRSYDFGWHLQTGEIILERGGSPPRQDPLAHTAPGREWVDHEWLFQVGLALLVRAGGVAATWWAKLVLLAAATLATVYGLHRRGVAPEVIALLGAVALEGARFRFSVRPELAGLALLPFLLLALDGGRSAAPGVRRRWLALVPPMVVLWVNLHPSALLAVGVVGAFSTGVLIEDHFRGRRAAAYGLLAILSGVCLMANPYGVEVLTVPLRIRAALSVPGISNPEWGNALQAPFWLFWALLPAMIAVWGIRARRVRLDLPLILVGGLLAVGAAAALRLQPFFYLALPWVMAGALAGSVRPPFRALRFLAPVLPALAAAVFVTAPRPAGLGQGPWLSPGRFPEAMARSFTSWGVQGPLYNPVRFGGYLSWVLDEPVFLDGRNEVHGPLLARIAGCRAAADVGCWDGVLDDWNVQAAIVEYDPRRLADRLPDGRVITRSAATVWFRPSRWALIDWDDTAMLFVRRAGANAALAREREDRWLTPDDPAVFARGLEIGAIEPAEAARELRRRLEAHPDSLRARRLEAILRSHAGGAPLARIGDNPPPTDTERRQD